MPRKIERMIAPTRIEALKTKGYSLNAGELEQEIRGQKYTFRFIGWRDNGSDLFQKVMELQTRVWGFEIDSAVPDNFLSVLAEIGGDLLIAFDDEDKARGFLFTVPTSDPCTLFLHMVGVDPEARYTGLGGSLMELEGVVAKERGIDKILWTYDPLRAGNAKLYVNKLRAVGYKYTVNKYGVYPGIYGESPTDRFTVSWNLNNPQVNQNGDVVSNVRVVDNSGQVETDKAFLVEIPEDVDNLGVEDVQRWRIRFREIALACLDVESRDSDKVFSGTHLVTDFYSVIGENGRVNYYLFTPKS